MAEQPAIVRTQDEVQYAHDLFHALVLKDIDLNVPADLLAKMASMLDVLCWLLGHNDNKHFERLLTVLKKEMARRGITVTKAPYPMTPEEYARWQAEQN